MSADSDASAARRDRPDFDRRPLVAVWETTQACDLACLHCRAEAQAARNPGELDTQEARRLLDDVRDLDPGVLVLSGGDPMKRPDLFDLLSYARWKGIRVAMTPSVTPLLTDDAIRRLATAGLVRIAFSLDGSSARIHDRFRGTPGAFDRTLEVVRVAREAGMSVQINTTISRDNLADLPAMAAHLRDWDLVLWSLFFLVPVGRGRILPPISPEQYEEVFAWLWSLRQQVGFEIKTTEAPHYRRFVMRALKEDHSKAAGYGSGTPGRFRYASMNVNDGRGFVFVSHTGEVYPSGFLPITVGNVRTSKLADLYRNAPLMRDLRNPDRLEGKCGCCEFRRICGGSRARAYAATGNPFAAEPDCLYRPAPSSLLDLD